jgi:lysophospholipase L1-like esterase
MFVSRLFAAGCLLALGLLVPAFAHEEKKDNDNPAAKPIDRLKQKGWAERHKLILKRIEESKGEGDVIFIGDSITQGWEGMGRKGQPVALSPSRLWTEHFGKYKPVNLGISGDQTGHALWRITEGKEIVNLKPKAAVIMIGTNNTGSHSAEQIAGGIKAIVEELRKQKPQMKILLLGVFPRAGKRPGKGEKVVPADQLQPKIKQINDIIAKLDDGKMVFYKDIGKEFLDPDGDLPADVMPDYLHLSSMGYEIWARAIKGDLEKLVK